MVKHLESDLWELREESASNIYRLIYCFLPIQRILMLHGFQKQSQRTPRNEIAVAQARLATSWHVKEVMTQVTHERHDATAQGIASYEGWRAELLADPEMQSMYEAEAAKKELWLQLVEARQAAGLTQAELAKRLGVSQAQVARIEKRGYDAYTLNTLRRYVRALGDDFQLDVQIHHRPGGLVRPRPAG